MACPVCGYYGTDFDHHCPPGVIRRREAEYEEEERRVEEIEIEDEEPDYGDRLSDGFRMMRGE